MASNQDKINLSSSGLVGVRGSKVQYPDSRPDSRGTHYGASSKEITFHNHLGFPVHIVDRHGVRTTVPHTEPILNNNSYSYRNNPPPTAHDMKKLYMEVTYKYLGNGTMPEYDPGYASFLENIYDSFTVDRPEYAVFVASISARSKSTVINSRTRDTLHEVTILYYLSIDDYKDAGYHVYWSEADVVVSREGSLKDTPNHPYNCRREAENTDIFPDLLKENDYQDGYYLKIKVVDNVGDRRTARYFKFLGSVKKVDIVQDHTLRDGVYVTEICRRSLVRPDATPETNYYTFEEADEKLRLFKTVEEADAYGDIKSHLEREVIKTKANVEIKKNELEERKIQHEVEKKIPLEEKKIDFEERKMRNDEHVSKLKEKAEERKYQHDFIKGGVNILSQIFAIIVLTLKFLVRKE